MGHVIEYTEMAKRRAALERKHNRVMPDIFNAAGQVDEVQLKLRDLAKKIAAADQTLYFGTTVILREKAALLGLELRKEYRRITERYQ